MKVAFLWVEEQILLALLSSWRKDNNFGVNNATMAGSFSIYCVKTVRFLTANNAANGLGASKKGKGEGIGEKFSSVASILLCTKMA